MENGSVVMSVELENRLISRQASDVVEVEAGVIHAVCVIVMRIVLLSVVCCREVNVLVSVMRCVVDCAEKVAAPNAKPISRPTKSEIIASLAMFTSPPSSILGGRVIRAGGGCT